MAAGGQDQQQPPQATVVERMNPAVQQHLNLDSVKTRAISLFKALSRILEEFNAAGIYQKSALPFFSTNGNNNHQSSLFQVPNMSAMMPSQSNLPRMQQGAQNLQQHQTGIVNMPNTAQTHPNFQQHRQNQQ